MRHITQEGLDLIKRFDGFSIGSNDLTQLTLPSHEAGRVVVRTCDTCDPIIHRVDEYTTYHIGTRGNAVSLKELREAAASVSDPGETLLYVMYSTESGVVTRITLSRAGR